MGEAGVFSGLVKSPGRPKIPEHRKRKKLNVTIPAHLIESASKKAESEGVDLSHYVEEAIKSQIQSDTIDESIGGEGGRK